MLRTNTYTWTQNRLETVQDQFRYLLMYGDVSEADIDKALYGVGLKVVQGIGIFGTDASGMRVAEVELRVDWNVNAQLTLTVPTIVGGLPGWKERQAPEIRVAGRRFAEVSRNLGLQTNYWVRFVRAVVADRARHRQLCDELGVSFDRGAPAWKSTPDERSETLLDLGEANVYIRRAGDR